MDRLIQAIAEYLCRHRSVWLLRLTLDLTRRRLDLFAEIGAVEVVKGAVAPPTPGTEAWWRAAVKPYTRYAREGWPSRRRGRVSQPDRPVDKLHLRPTKPPTAKNGVLSRLTPLFSFFGAPKNGVSSLPNAE